MTTFTSLFQTGIGFGEGIVDILDAYARTILAPREYRSVGGGHASPASPVRVEDVPIDFGIPELPVAILPEGYFPGPAAGARQVRTGPVGDRDDYPPPPSAWDQPTAEEQEELGYDIVETAEGDFYIPGGFGVAVFPHDLDTAPPVEQDEMAHDWMHLGRQVLGSWAGVQQEGFNALGPAFAAAGTDVARPSGSAALPPSAAPLQLVSSGQDCGNRRYVTLDRQTGKISCRRRRRRRLLTNRDLADLASLKTITGGGAALNSAVIRAVR